MALPKLKPWQTFAAVVLVIVASVGLFGVGCGIIEAITLTDDVPGNHITAVFRHAWQEQPGAILIAIIVLEFIIVAPTMFVWGHLFWCDPCPDPEQHEVKSL